MTGRFWRYAPWWIASVAAVLALLDLQFGIAGRTLSIAALAIGVAGILAAQLVRHGQLEPGDWFAGLWSNANLVGVWGSVTLGVCAVRLLTKTIDARGSRAWVAAWGHAAAALFLVWGASAKIYSVSVFG